MINLLDHTPGRQVWYQYWDSLITFPKSYFARLNYVNQNPVKHRLVENANQYPWCSASWFENGASPAFLKSVMRFKTDKIQVYDDF